MAEVTLTRHQCDTMSCPYDVIVVLGAAVWPGGQPSPALRRRVAHAVRLFHAGQARMILMTGGLGTYPPPEAHLMRDLAVAQRVPAQAVIMEDGAHSTFDSAVRCVPILRQHGWTTALVVTDRYHLPRAVLTFRSVGVRAVGRGIPRQWTRRDCWKCLLVYGRECVACVWYVWLILRWRLQRGEQGRAF